MVSPQISVHKQHHTSTPLPYLAHCMQPTPPPPSTLHAAHPTPPPPGTLHATSPPAGTLHATSPPPGTPGGQPLLSYEQCFVLFYSFPFFLAFDVGGLGFVFCVFVAGWRHALRSEWPFVIIVYLYLSIIVGYVVLRGIL